MSTSLSAAAPAAQRAKPQSDRIAQILMLTFALLLPSLSWQEAVGAGLLAVFFSWMVLPQLDSGSVGAGPISWHPLDLEACLRRPAVIYSVSVLLLLLTYRHHLEVAAAAWAVLALGCSASDLAGEMIGGPRLSWNPEKRWVGSLSFVITAAPVACVLMLWVRPSLALGKAAIICAIAALLGAAVDSAPIALDEELTVPLMCGGFIFCATLTGSDALHGNLPYLGRRLILAIVVNLVFAFLALRSGTANPSGAGLGALLGTLVYLGWGWKSFLILLIFFALGSLATRLGYATKAVRGVAEQEGGARGWQQALANVGPGAFFAVMVITTRQEHAFLLAFVAAFAQAAGDTVSSEIGQWLAPRAYLITTFREVAAGENGGVSLAGSMAGLLASIIIALLGWVLGLTGVGGAVIVLGAAIGGNLFDSLLGATIERRGLVTNGIVNFAGTAFAGALALAVTLR